MNTTTITGQGVSGQQVTKELPAQGEIVVLTLSSRRTGTRHETVKVTGYDTRAITGTGFCYYVVVGVTATGEELADHRYRPATADEAAAFTPAADAPAEIIPAETTARLAHSTACRVCRVSSETGRVCPEGIQLADAERRARHDLTRAPIITVNRWGARRAHWDAASALADLAFNGGEIIQAPAGMIEAGRREQARQAQQLREQAAARPAGWQPAALRRLRRR
ncbi:hypothetical protein [Streptomyces longwoodensis]|uniref:hypothetical protein n=1 Tax=Streptomyces longwoodensis TaxID=68231 RepID=UPI0036FE2A36